jgi:hypothetical protein
VVDWEKSWQIVPGFLFLEGNKVWKKKDKIDELGILPVTEVGKMK